MATASSVRYEIIERLVSSDAVDVYEAVHPDKPGRLLLEVFHAARQAPWAFAECLRELETIAALAHPNLWQGVESGTLPDGAPMLVTEQGQGCSLGDWLEGSVRIGAEEVAALIRDLAAALDAAHEAGVAHGLLSAETVHLPDGLDAAPRAPQLQGFGRRWLQALLDGAGTVPEVAPAVSSTGASAPGSPASRDIAREVPWQTQRARDLGAFALLVERLLVPSALATEAIERRFALGPEVSAVIDRATRPGAMPFTTAGALAAALVKAIGQDGIALRPSETMAVGSFFASAEGEVGEEDLSPIVPSAFRRRLPLLATGATAGLVALVMGLPSLKNRPPAQAPKPAAVSAPTAPSPEPPRHEPEAKPIAPAPDGSPAPAGEESAVPKGGRDPASAVAEPAEPMSERDPASTAMAAPRGDRDPEPTLAESAERSAGPARPRAPRVRAKPTFVWSPSLGRLVAVDERGLPLPTAPAP